MKKATIFLKEKVAPGGMDWMHVYEIIFNTAVGVMVKDGQLRRYFFPAHLIQRIEYED
jgi:hypothetical protein